MTEQYKIDTVAIILAEMLKESRKDNITKGEFHKLPINYAERLVKLFSASDVSNCTHENTSFKSMRCNVCDDCGDVIEIEV